MASRRAEGIAMREWRDPLIVGLVGKAQPGDCRGIRRIDAVGPEQGLDLHAMLPLTLGRNVGARQQDIANRTLDLAKEMSDDMRRRVNSWACRH
jgi:hypothetical protein